MTAFKHYGVSRIHFGPGSMQELPAILEELKLELGLPKSFTTLVICGRHAQDSSLPQIQDLLAKSQVKMETFILPSGEPELASVDAGIEAAQDASLVIGLGGGSALDAAKAIGGLAKLPGRAEEYFFGRTPDKPSLPWLGIPTTAGSGAEVTNNAVLIHQDKKQSVRSPLWFAKAAIVDPELTLSLPPKQTAICGLDALTHATEGYLSRFSTPLSDLLSLRAVELVVENLPGAVTGGHDLKAREGLLLGSLLSAKAFVNSRLGAVHGLAHPIGVRSGQPHGLVCGMLLPHVFLYNLPQVTSKAEDLAKIFKSRAPEDIAEKIWQLLAQFQLPKTLSAIGIKQEELAAIAKESLPSASMAANPKNADFKELMLLLERAF